jgi:hypothetical protein
MTALRLCRECGDELHPAENDISGLCDGCWEDRVEEVYDILDSDGSDEIHDPLAQRDDEMGM